MSSLTCIWCECMCAQAVECFAVNPRRALLAYSTRIPSPPITVVGFPTGTDRATLTGGTQIPRYIHRYTYRNIVITYYVFKYTISLS
jgi:hypothetical protein